MLGSATVIFDARMADSSGYILQQNTTAFKIALEDGSGFLFKEYGLSATSTVETFGWGPLLSHTRSRFIGGGNILIG